MASLKDYRDRISGVKSTRKITSAMKMVAAAKLRKAQSRAEQSKPYAVRMERLLARSVTAAPKEQIREIDLLKPVKNEKKRLLIAVSADRGLCGPFNHIVVKEVKQAIYQLRLEGKKAEILCIGEKCYDALKREYGPDIVGHYPLSETFQAIRQIVSGLIKSYEERLYDRADLFYNRFENTLKQVPTNHQIIPYVLPDHMGRGGDEDEALAAPQILRSIADIKPESAADAKSGWYEFEPGSMAILEALIPAQISAILFNVTLEVAAGEQAARMTAMDNATRNAKEMISDLTLEYNRVRQAAITREVTEIVSAAEAMKS